MPKLENIPRVTHASTDLEIIEAIEAAGEHKYPWRPYDRAQPGDNNPLSWIMAGDIGHSTVADKRLLKRLKDMVKRGILETVYKTHRVQNVSPPGWTPHYITRGTYPRFRVAKGGRDFIT